MNENAKLEYKLNNSTITIVSKFGCFYTPVFSAVLFVTSYKSKKSKLFLVVVNTFAVVTQPFLVSASVNMQFFNSKHFCDKNFKNEKKIFIKFTNQTINIRSDRRAIDVNLVGATMVCLTGTTVYPKSK